MTVQVLPLVFYLEDRCWTKGLRNDNGVYCDVYRAGRVLHIVPNCRLRDDLHGVRGRRDTEAIRLGNRRSHERDFQDLGLRRPRAIFSYGLLHRS